MTRPVLPKLLYLSQWDCTLFQHIHSSVVWVVGYKSFDSFSTDLNLVSICLHVNNLQHACCAEFVCNSKKPSSMTTGELEAACKVMANCQEQVEATFDPDNTSGTSLPRNMLRKWLRPDIMNGDFLLSAFNLCTLISKNKTSSTIVDHGGFWMWSCIFHVA